jgi:hypothetical protein
MSRDGSARCTAWLPVALVLLAAVIAAPVPAAAEPLLVIAHADHADAQLPLAELSLVYKRKKLFWPSARSRIQPANLPVRDASRRRFSRAVLGAQPEALDNYWNELYFQGIRPPHVVASAAAMLRFVAETRHALGYVPACQLQAGRPQVAVLGWIDDDGSWHPGTPPDRCPPS